MDIIKEYDEKILSVQKILFDAELMSEFLSTINVDFASDVYKQSFESQKISMVDHASYHRELLDFLTDKREALINTKNNN